MARWSRPEIQNSVRELTRHGNDSVDAHEKVMHRNKEYWGENADKFDPTRFLPDSPNLQTHDYAWLPFSSGPRG